MDLPPYDDAYDAEDPLYWFSLEDWDMIYEREYLHMMEYYRMLEEEPVFPDFDSNLDAEDPLYEEYANAYLASIEYSRFDSFMEQMKNDIYNQKHFGHEDGPDAYAAELLAEEELAEEIAKEEAWIDHLNPLEAFEKQKRFEMDVLGMYPGSHDRYEWYSLKADEAIDDDLPLPKNEDECSY